MTIRVLVAMLATMFLAGSAAAQRSESPAPGERRAQLEQRFQQQTATVLRNRLELTDAQLAQLTRTNARFEERRRLLVSQERELRIDMRRELSRGNEADQQRIAGLVDRSFALQRQRLDLLEEEQRELAAFLTPHQRAMFLSMQEQIRHRAEEMRRQRLNRGSPGAPMRRPPRNHGGGGGGGG